MSRTVQTRHRKPWVHVEDGDLGAVHELRVSDGQLRAIVSPPNTLGNQLGWHISISFRDNRGELSRYPAWDEIAYAREQLLPGDITMAMLLPPEEEFVAVHHTTFHLHQIQTDEVDGIAAAD